MGRCNKIEIEFNEMIKRINESCYSRTRGRERKKHLQRYCIDDDDDGIPRSDCVNKQYR